MLEAATPSTDTPKSVQVQPCRVGGLVDYQFPREVRDFAVFECAEDLPAYAVAAAVRERFPELERFPSQDAVYKWRREITNEVKEFRRRHIQDRLAETQGVTIDESLVGIAVARRKLFNELNRASEKAAVAHQNGCSAKEYALLSGAVVKAAVALGDVCFKSLDTWNPEGRQITPEAHRAAAISDYVAEGMTPEQAAEAWERLVGTAIKALKAGK
jgi:hypothetical protein